MKWLLILFVLIVAAAMAFFTSLGNGSFIHFLDTHPNPDYVPKVEFTLADVYYELNDLQDSATYYLRIAERYPKSSLADDAYFGYAQSLEEMNAPREDVIAQYKAYLEKFPEGKHAEVIPKRLEYLQNHH